MEIAGAALAFSALGHQPRLEVFRLLVNVAPEGMSAGDIARATGARPNTLSNSLNILNAAGLIKARREGRSIIYTVALEGLVEMMAFLVEHCCGGQLDRCGPLSDLAGRLKPRP